jgi:hypothetical protein
LKCKWCRFIAPIHGGDSEYAWCVLEDHVLDEHREMLPLEYFGARELESLISDEARREGWLEELAERGVRRVEIDLEDED